MRIIVPIRLYVHHVCKCLRVLMLSVCVVVLVSIGLFVPSVLFGQKAIRPKEVPAGQVPNFYQVQKDWNGYFEALKKEKLLEDPANANPLRGSGYKQYKRWEWYWQSRTNPDGSFPDFIIPEKELQKIQSKKSNDELMQTANWTPWGPTKAAGGYWGVGRVNAVVVTLGTVYAATAGGGLWTSSDNGNNWTNPTASLSGLGTSDICFGNSASLGTMVMYLATGDYLGSSPSGVPSIGVFKSTDGGATWSATGLVHTRTDQVRIARILCYPTNPNIVIAASNLGIHRSTDGGTTWTLATLTTPLGDNVEFVERFMDMEMKAGDPSVMVASTSLGRIYRSTDGGASWAVVSGSLPAPTSATTGRAALAVGVNDPNTMYAIYTNRSNRGFLALFKSTDGGASWAQVTVASPTNTFAYSNEGTDAGGQGEYDLCLTVSPVDANRIYLGAVNLWTSANGGTNWTCIGHWAAGTQTGDVRAPEVHADQHYVYVPQGSTTLFVANDGGIYSTANNGTSWTWHVNGNTGINMHQIYRISTSQTDPNRLLIGAQDNSTTLLNGANVIERTQATGDGMGQAIDRENVQNMLTSGTNGSLQRSTDQGASWSKFFEAENRNSEAGAWVTPYVQSSTNANTVFFGYVNVWRTDNAWAETPTFTRISTGGTGSLQVVAVGQDGLSIYVSTGTPGEPIRYTPNGGATWFERTPPGTNSLTKITVHTTRPTTAWATFGGYTAGEKVYRTDDGATTWTNISGSLPNVPANVILAERNSPDRVYVGTDLGVYYRDASTSDWVKYNGGALANDNIVVTDMDIQYSQRQLRIGTYSRGAFSGGLVGGAIQQTTTITITPSTVNFGTVNIGQSSTQNITVNVSNVAVGATITISITGTGFTATPLSFVADQTTVSRTVALVFTPTSSGSVAGTVRIQTANIQQTASLAGVGATVVTPQFPQLTVTPSALAFGTITSGTAVVATQTLTVNGSGFSANQVITPSTAQSGITFAPSALTANAQGSIPQTPIAVTWAVPSTLPLGLSNGVIAFSGTTSTVTFSVTVTSGTTSIGRPIIGANFHAVAVPNPATDFVNIDWSSLAGEIYTVSVVNTIGREVARFNGRSTSDNQRIQWVTENIANGAYTVRIEPCAVSTA
jgi:hypothetical protein